MDRGKRKTVEELIGAILTDDQPKLELLLSRGFNPNLTDDHCLTPLMIASGRGRLNFVKLLLGNGANVNAQGFHGPWPMAGKTALMMAASEGHLDVVKELITAGAKLDAQDADGETALMKAAFNGHANIVEYLFAHGASLGIENDAGETAMTLAESIGQVKITELLKGRQ